MVYLLFVIFYHFTLKYKYSFIKSEETPARNHLVSIFTRGLIHKIKSVRMEHASIDLPGLNIEIPREKILKELL